MGYFTQQNMIGPSIKPVLDSQVDFDQETVEGRIGGLLKTDGQGNYENQVVRQTVDRQDQAFNARGLRNSSMAVQAGAEAAISRAADIAAPDAQTFYNNRRSNVDAANTLARDEMGFQRDMVKQEGAQDFDREKMNSTQAFETRNSYQRAVQTIGTNYQRQLDTINSSSMTPEDKTVAIQQAAAVRDGEIAFQNNLYAKMPQWQNDWLSAAVPTGGMDMATVSNPDALANIANDPAQSQATRDAAAARLQALQGGGAGAPGAGQPAPTVGAGPAAGQPYPNVVAGMMIDWAGQRGPDPSFQQQYEAYAGKAGQRAVSPEQWFMAMYGGGSMIGAGTSSGSAAAGQGAADAVSSGSVGGNGIGPGDF